MIKRLYYNFFYHVFNSLRFERNRDGRAYASSFLISLFESFNIASFVYLWKVSNKVEFNFKIIFIFTFVLISLFNLFIFNKNRKYEKIISGLKEMESKNKSVRFLSYSSIFLYFLISFLFLAFAVLMDAVVGDFRIVLQYLEQKFF